MTDTTLVANVTEEDMGKVRQIFDHALNAIVGMSQLSKDVETLRAQVGDLTSTVTRYRSQIDTLDEALYRTRQERDAATQKVNETAQAKEHAESKLYETEQSLDHLRSDNSQLNDRLVAARRESDDHMMRALEAEDKLAKAEAKLQEVRGHFKSLFPEEPGNAPSVAVVAPPEPQPENVVTIPVISQDIGNPPAPVNPPQPTQEKAWWEKEMELNEAKPFTA